ncbi:ABC transporter permease subunit [Streptomyces sp. TRM S81-3]|uniref:ABC transporter permease subunit n=1 Tax=Streptomyces griseicoloratus TaxID=2752516 RepID=A0A926L328_9ACTN|nr:ABC transporter permease subunit [Streptomyces griseicoloratus]MBD0421635.1 ABC transporter permease subunit [Streptomyces griseicoloratus]
MHVLLDNADLFLEGFAGSVRLTVASTLLALLLGVALAACRVSPVPLLRALSATAVRLLCSTPLTVLFFGVTLGLPVLGLTSLGYFSLAVLTLGAYSGAFLCEALRSGVNTVDTSQAEAGRGLGLSPVQVAWLIVLPQAARTALSPARSIIVTLAKNSALAGGFSVPELFGAEKALLERGYAVGVVFLWVTLAYLLLIALISGVFLVVERRLAVPC